MPAPAFVDTNILVYADDRRDSAKQSRAQDLIRQLIREKTGRLSTQVLAEYFVAARRKLGIDAVDARRRVELYSRFDVVTLHPADILGAIDLHRLHGFSLWGALIVPRGAPRGVSHALLGRPPVRLSDRGAGDPQSIRLTLLGWRR